MDLLYWNAFYSKGHLEMEPTRFAKDILPLLKSGSTLVELGCGNGRDSLYFAKNNIQVTAIDQASSAINKLQIENDDNNVIFVTDNFVHSELLEEKQFDYAYSRFTIHSITEEDQEILLKKVYRCLRDQGQIFIEARSTKDEIFGKGEKVGRNSFIYNGHYRRFIVLEELIQQLEKKGFEVVYKVEEAGLAKYKNENPIVIRVIAKKNS